MSTHTDVLSTPLERKEAAKPFLEALQKHVPAGFALLEVDPYHLDLVDFRMDCLARLEKLQEQPEAEEERADVIAELDACELEIRKFCGPEVAKVDNFANIWRAFEMAEAYQKDARDRHGRKAKRCRAILEWLETIAMEALVLADRPRFDSPNNTLRVQRNPPKVHYTDPNAIPDRFRKVTLELPADRWKQMREALPELVQYVTEKERTFMTAAIAKVLKAAKTAEDQILQNTPADLVPGEFKKVERVRGAELRSDKRLVVE